MIKGLKPIELEKYGSDEWFAQHQIFEKLNNQAHWNAIKGNEKDLIDEFNIE